MKTEQQEYLDEKRQEIERMTEHEQIVSKTILILAQVILEILNRLDVEALAVLKDGVSNLFEQAESILKHKPKHLQ